MQDPDKLRTGVAKMHKNHVTNRGGKRCASLEPELREEFVTHTDYLAKTVESLKRKVLQDSEMHRADISSVMVENLSLIKEIHELRRDIRNIRNAAPADQNASVTASGTVGGGTVRPLVAERQSTVLGP